MPDDDSMLGQNLVDFRNEERRHGHNRCVNLDAFLGADPELALVNADPVAWSQAHPCECDAMCECEEAA